MINFSKINNLLTNKGTQKGQQSFGLSCVVHDLYMTPIHTVQYIYFETSNKVPCLLYVNPENFEIHNDIFKKETELTLWPGHEQSTGYVLTGDNDIDVLPEISVSISPEPYTDLIKMLSKSIKDTSYRIALMVEDFLIVHDGGIVATSGASDKVGSTFGGHIFNINGCENPKLLIVVDLLTLMNDLSVTKIERVFNAINTIMTETCDKYWVSLRSLLLKCQELKIITKGKKCIDVGNMLTNMVKLQSSDRAIKLALENLKL